MDADALAALAGSAVVTAVVTDAWEDVRRKVAWVFGRGRADPQIERRLGTMREQLDAVEPADLEQVKAIQVAHWTTRFGDLLADRPDAQSELRALVEEIQAMRPVTATGHSATAGRDVTVHADRGGVAAGVIHGDVTTGPTMPGPANG